MTSTSSIQKAAVSQALTLAKAALRGIGAAETRSNVPDKVETASTKTKKAGGYGVTLAKQRLRKPKIRI